MQQKCHEMTVSLILLAKCSLACAVPVEQKIPATIMKKKLKKTIFFQIMSFFVRKLLRGSERRKSRS